MKIMIFCSGRVSDGKLVAASWVEALIDGVLNYTDNEIVLVMPSYGGKTTTGKLEKVSFCLYGRRKEEHRIDKNAINELKLLFAKEVPDVIHICGTEYIYALEVALAANSLGIENRMLLVIQGLCSQIARHYYDTIPVLERYRFTVRDFLRMDNICLQRKKMAKRGNHEKKAIQSVQYISGRTDWDEASVFDINPMARYLKCGEIIRREFYEHQWSVSQCKRHSIFVSQYYYTIKGFHILLDAVGLLKSEFPDITIHTTGKNILQKSLRDGVYAKYLRRKIERLGLQESVFFHGPLNASQMCEQYRNCNVFVSPSLIENSSNSIAEALIVGSPVVSSLAGGAGNFVSHGETGYLYQANAPYMLAHYIRKIFRSDEIACQLSLNSRKSALEMYNTEQSIDAMIRIYQTISELADETDG